LEKEISALLRTIRERPTATFYVNTSSIKSSSAVKLSVRVSGVECGWVALSKRKKDRKFTPRNVTHFAECWESRVRSLPWEHGAVQRYLTAADCVAKKRDLLHRERGVEAALIQELKGKRILPNHKPIIFPVKNGVPYQFPVPITARGGVRRSRGNQAGHVDVLARHGRGRPRLRILEVKKRDAADAGAALDQAVAYAAAIDVLLDQRAPYQALYQALFAFNYRPKLEATAVVGDTPENRERVRKAHERLSKGPNKVGFRLSALFYCWEKSGNGHRLEVTESLDR
jgi:hypothetical protein